MNSIFSHTPPSLDQLTKDYETIYRDNPMRWDEPYKDEYAFEVVRLYLKGTNREIPDTMLDIGCGSGHTMEYFLRQWPIMKVYGIDLSGRAIEITQKRVPKASCIASSLDKVIIPKKVEFITAIGVLEHCTEPIQAFSKIQDLLSPTGMAYIEVPNCIAYPDSEKSEGFRKLTGGSQQWEWHLFRKSWEELIRSSGLFINLSLRGPKPEMEFIWVVTPQEQHIPFLSSLALHGYEKGMLAKRILYHFMYRLYKMTGILGRFNVNRSCY